MAVLTALQAASPLDLSDDVRLTFTADLTETLSRALDDVNADLGNMDTLSWQVEASLSGVPTDDSYTLGLRIMAGDGTTVLAAADSTGTFVTVATDPAILDTVFGAPTAFAYVNTTANKATWDGANVELRQTYTKTKAADALSLRVDWVEFTGTYTAAVANTLPTAAATATPNPAPDETTVIALDGTGSTDPDGTISSYQWELISSPAGYTGTFDTPTAATTNFTPAVASAFNPLTQVTPLHAVWAEDANWTTKPADGGLVDSWRNQSGGGDPASTGTNRPTYRASVAAFNSKPAVEFVRANTNYLDVVVTDIAQPFKLVIVASVKATGVTHSILSRGAVNAAHGFQHWNTNVWRLAYGTAIASTTATDTNPHAFRANANGASSVILMDGTQIASGDVNTGSQARFTMGAATTDGAAFSAPLDGYIAFLGIYDGATTDADLDQLVTDLKTHYGIA